MTVSKIRLILTVLFVLLLVNTVGAGFRTFRVEEGDFVKIEPEAVDPDKDQVTYYYTYPLNDKGEWWTGPDDAGEYEVKITATDGDKRSVETIKLIVENKNQPPFLSGKQLVVNEGQLIDLKELVQDPDDDPLSYQFERPFDKNGRWQTDFEDEGHLVTEFEVSDGQFDVVGRVEINVQPTNQPPVIEGSFSDERIISAEEDSSLPFWVEVNDIDNEPITYRWELDGDVISETAKGEHSFGFESAEDYELSVTVTDSSGNEINREWEIIVTNVNRKPTINPLPVTVQEGKRLVLQLPQKDIDGDILKYSFDEPLDDVGEWQTDYEDAGEYEVEITFSDGEFIEREEIKITVIDVDRGPSLLLPRQIEMNEGQKFSWKINTNDPDGDEVTITFQNLPKGSEFDAKTETLLLQPDYDFIRRDGGFFSNILNALRLEHFFLREKETSLGIESCGKELCTSGTVPLIIRNVNRAPELNKIADITVTETELTGLEPSAVDPDGDIIHYYFTSPLGKRDGKWETDYEDEGTHTIWVTATDGKLGHTTPVQVHVQKKNREPTIKVRDDELVVNEGQQFMFKVDASDPDKEDELTIRLDNIPWGASFADGIFLWEPNHATVLNKTNGWNSFVGRSGYLNKKLSKDEAVVWLSFVVTDGEADVVHPVKVTVKNVNQAPEIIGAVPEGVTTVDVNEPVIFKVTATDVDDDPLSYKWDFGFSQQKVSGTDTVQRTYLAPGEKEVRVVVSDGWKEVEKTWKVKVVGETFVQDEGRGQYEEVIEEPREEPPTQPTPIEELKHTFRVYVLKV